MNKKRILALLLAVSMTVPSNVAFAAEPVADEEVMMQTEATETKDMDAEEEILEDSAETEEILPEETEESTEVSDGKTEEVVDEQPEELEEEVVEIPELESVTVDESTWKDYFKVSEDGTLEISNKTVFKETATVVIPASVSKIPTGIFDSSSGPKVVKFETRENKENAAATLTIEECAFSGTSVQYIDDIPDGLTEIADRAFYRAKNLKGITFENIETLKKIGKQAFTGSGIEELDLRNASGLEYVAQQAFYGAKYLKTVYWINRNCNAAKSIPHNAFNDCDDLTYVYLGNYVESIGVGAFKSCDDLATINLPVNVEKIQSGAFAECKSLKRVYFRNGGNDADCSTEIAQDAFPSRGTDLTVYGYDGTAQEYAGNMGFVFRTLYTKYAISTSVNDSELGTVEVSKESARPGDVIRITITCGEEKDAYIDKNSITINGEALEDVAWLVKTTDTEMIYDFEMPSTDVKIYAAFKENASTGNLAVRADVDGENVTWEEKVTSKDKTEYYLHFDKAGSYAPLTFYRNGQKLASSEMTFSSSNTNVVAVSKDGIVRSTGWGNVANKPGTYYVTATLKGGSSVKIYVTVGDARATEKDKDADAYNPVTDDTDVVFYFSGREFDSDKAYEEGDGGYYDVRYPNYKLATQSRSLDVYMLVGEDDDSFGSFVDAEWKVVDSDIASVKYSTTNNNYNTITVKKDAEGETAIVVTIKSLQYNEEKKKVETVKTTRTIILEVYDPTPRLEDSTVTLYRKQAEPASVTLVPVYEKGNNTTSSAYDISKLENLKIKEMTEKNNDKVYTEIKGLEVTYNKDSGKFDIKTSSDFEKKVGTYSNKWYITGNYEGESKTFYIQIPTAKVAEAMTTPSAVLAETKKTVYAGVENQEFEIQILDKSTKKELELPDDAQVTVVSNKQTIGKDQLDVDDACIYYTPEKLQAENLTITVTSEYWTKPLTLKYSIGVTSKVAKLKYNTTKVTFSNSNSEGEYSWIDVDDSLLTAQGIELNNITASSDDFDVEYYRGNVTAGGGWLKISPRKHLQAGNYKLTLQPVARDKVAELASQVINVTVADAKKVPSVTVKASESINVLDSTSKIVYTPTFTNIGNGYKSLTVSDKINGSESDYFEITPWGDLYAKDTAKAGTKYTIYLTYTVNEVQVTTKALTVTPVETQPTVTFDKTKVTMFAGQRYADISADLTTVKKTFTGAKIVGYTFAKSTSDDVKAAFTLTAKDNADKGLTVKLSKPGRLKLNKSYTLKIVPVYAGQKEETAAAKNKAVSVVVNLKK